MARGADETPSWHWFGDGTGAPDQGLSGGDPEEYGADPRWLPPRSDQSGHPLSHPQYSDATQRLPWNPDQPVPPAPREPQAPPVSPAMGQPPASSTMGQPPIGPVMGQPPTGPAMGQPAADPAVGQPAKGWDADRTSRFLPFGQPPPDPPAPPPPPPPPVWPYYDAQTAMIPRVAFYETAIIPKAVDEPTAPPTLAELAARYGLKPAGTRPKLGEYTRQVWRFREFISFYANSRLLASVGNARLGQLWLVLNPLLNAGIYFVIFGLVLNLGRDVDNFIGYLTAGFFVFVYTQSAAQGAVTSISGQLGLVRAMQFPRASLPIATIIMQVQNFLIALVVLLGIVVATGEPVTLRWLALIPAFVLQTIFTTGLAFALARIGAKVSDARQILPIVLRVWMYLSALFYSVEVYDALPPTITTIVHWNPLLIYIEIVRYAVLTNPPLTSTFVELCAKGAIWALVALLVGYLYFWRGEAEYGRG